MKARDSLLELAGDVIGLRLERFEVSPEHELQVNRLIEERSECRKDKQWQRADEIRNRLAELGIILEDTPEGTKIVWKRTPEIEVLNNLLAELGIAL